MRILTCAWVLPVASPAIRHGAVAIEGNEIVAVGPSDQVLARYGDRAIAGRSASRRSAGGAEDPILDLGEGLLLPAFANAHTHLELSWMASEPPPRGDPLRWVRAMNARRVPSEVEVRSGIEASLRALRSKGTALVGDVGNTTAAAAPLLDSGLEGCFFLELLGPRLSGRDAAAERAARLLEDATGRLEASLTGPSAGPSDPEVPPARPPITGSIVPHGLHTVSRELLERLAVRARAFRSRLSVHLAETDAEVSLLRDGSGPFRDLLEESRIIGPDWRPPGRSPAEILDEAGLLGPRTLLVHGVHLSSEDARLVARRGATLVLCPRSNAWLGAGRAPVAMFLQQNVPLALGTDSLASNSDLDILGELAALRRLVPAVPSGALLRAATLGGAEALDRSSFYGSIEPGKRAALLVIRPRRIARSVEATDAAERTSRAPERGSGAAPQSGSDGRDVSPSPAPGDGRAARPRRPLGIPEAHEPPDSEAGPDAILFAGPDHVSVSPISVFDRT